MPQGANAAASLAKQAGKFAKDSGALQILKNQMAQSHKNRTRYRTGKKIGKFAGRMAVSGVKVAKAFNEGGKKKAGMVATSEALKHASKLGGKVGRAAMAARQAQAILPSLTAGKPRERLTNQNMKVGKNAL